MMCFRFLSVPPHPTPPLFFFFFLRNAGKHKLSIPSKRWCSLKTILLTHLTDLTGFTRYDLSVRYVQVVKF